MDSTIRQAPPAPAAGVFLPPSPGMLRPVDLAERELLAAAVARTGRPPRKVLPRGMPGLRAALDAGGCSQRALARLLSVSQTTIANWLAGRRDPHPRSLRAVAAALGVEPTALVPPLEAASPLAAWVAELTPRERDIFVARVAGLAPATVDELAARHGVSPERIAEVERAVARRFDRSFTAAPVA